jgi:Tol biopolymer transport system component
MGRGAVGRDRRRTACRAVLLATLIAGVLDVADAVGFAGPFERVSVGGDGAQADGRSLGPPALSADGRYVAFASYAANLVTGDTNRVADVFVRNRATGAVDRVSVGSEGEEADRSSTAPAISADGRFVAFQSNATVLVPDDTNRRTDVFVHDRLSGVTERTSVDSEESQADFLPSGAPAISADGRFVAFESNASDLVPGDRNRLVDAGTPGDVFVRDREAGTTERVSVDADGREVLGISAAPSISASGRYVAFESDASALAPEGSDIERRLAVYLHDRLTGATTRVSVGGDGRAADAPSDRPALSGDGSVVVFRSAAANLVAGLPADGTPRLYVRELRLGTTALVSAGVTGAVERAAVDGDGGTVAVATAPAPTPPGAPQPAGDIFVVDRDDGVLDRVTTPAGGGVADVAGTAPALSADGDVMAFVSQEFDLVPGDDNGMADVFAAVVGDAPVAGPRH